MKKIFIVKLGYTETLDNEISVTTSLGDVLRTTFILHYFKDCHVSWLVDKTAFALLEDNPYINKIYCYTNEILEEISRQYFDIVINFEKLPEVCNLAQKLKAKDFYGFTFDGVNHGVHSHSLSAKKLIDISQDVQKRINNKDCWQKILADAIDQEWDGQEYILGYKPTSKETNDVGFNWTTSRKWVNKPWPKKYWDRLYLMLKDKYSISWQQGMESLHQYIEWINSCKVIVTADSLGLHLALALKKKVVALFGPTSFHEIYSYNCGVFLIPQKTPYQCIPCCRPACFQKKACIEFITVNEVIDAIEQYK